MAKFSHRALGLGRRLLSGKPEISPFLTFKPSEGSRHHPVIFTHGIFGNKRVWRNTCAIFSEKQKYECYALDMRHHGDWGKCPMIDFHLLAEDLKVFLDHHQIKKLHLVGHSLGGKVVMAFSQLYPQYAQSLTVVDISPRKYKTVDRFLTWMNAMSRIKLDTMTNRSQIRSALLEILKDSKICDFLLINLRQEGQKFEWSFTFETFIPSFETITDFPTFRPEFKGPTLFIVGDSSDFVSASDFPHMLDLYPQARIEVVENATHNVYVDQREKFLQLLGTFLDAHD